MNIKPKKEKSQVIQTSLNKLCVVFRANNIIQHAKVISETLGRLRPDHLKMVELVLVSSEKIELSQMGFAPAEKYPAKISILKTSDSFKTELSHVLIVDCDLLDKTFNLSEILSIKLTEGIEALKLSFLSTDEKKSHSAYVWICKCEIVAYVLGLNIPTTNFDYIFRKENLKTDEQTLNQSLSSKNIKSFVQNFTDSLKRFFQWYIYLPIREMKLSKQNTPTFIQNREPAIYRLLFFVIAIGLMFTMTHLSKDAGVSGDEMVNYNHAKLVYEYYAKGDKSAVDVRVNPNLDRTMLQYYGQSFDNITYFVNKITNTDSPFESRHLMNSLVGWLIILITGLLLSHIAGWRAAIIGMIMLFVSPRFLGHSFNNPKDIPFAFAYVFSIFQMILWAKELPKIKIKRIIWIVLGIAMAISVRIGGLMLVAFLFMIVGLWYITSRPLKDFLTAKYLSGGFKYIFILLGMSIAAFFVGIILWPYAIESPIKHSRESLAIMTNFSVGIRQLFNGENIWSDRAPWDYLPKYIFMTIPMVAILGLALFIALIKKVLKKSNELFVFVIVFAFFFPVFYIIYQKSNVYGGWRHVLFIYPFLVMAASLGFDGLLHLFKSKYIRDGVWIVIAGFMFLPLKHITKNHPHEYIYYNELSGGVDKAYGFYEMDYYYHSMREASFWLNDYIKKDNPKPTKKTVVVSNNMGITQYYFRHDTATVAVGYIRYYERGTIDWDYCIIVNSYIDANQLQTGMWPPKNTIHTIEVDGKPICAILKRDNRDDYLGFSTKATAEGIKDNPVLKDSLTKLSISYFKSALKADSRNETALLSLTETYMNMQNLDTAMYYVDILLAVYPSYENGLNYKGWLSIQTFDKTQNQKLLTDAQKAFETIIKVNYKYIYGYYGLAMTYIRMNQLDKAMATLEDGMKVNPNFPPVVELYNQLRTHKSQGGM